MPKIYCIVMLKVQIGVDVAGRVGWGGSWGEMGPSFNRDRDGRTNRQIDR